MVRSRFGTVRYRKDRDAWFVQFSFERRQYQRRAGRTEAEASRKLKAVELALEAGKGLPAVLHDVFGDVTGYRLTFRDAAPLYLQHAEPRKKRSTFRGDVHRLRVLCRAAWAGKFLGRITPHDLTKWSTERMSRPRGVSGPTVNRDLDLASALFRWAMTMGYVTENPTSRVVRAPEAGRERTLWLTVAECAALLSVASAAFHPALLCLLHAGLRRGEVLTLEWRSVDLERTELVVEPEFTKNGKARVVPLTPQLAERLRELSRAPHTSRSKVFVRSDGTPWTEGTLASSLKRAADACVSIDEDKRRRITLHVLRHTFASHLVQAGCPLGEIAQLLGHHSTYVTQRYAHHEPDVGKAPIAALGRRLGGGSSGGGGAEPLGGRVSEQAVPYRAGAVAEIVPRSCPGAHGRIAS